MNGLLRRMASRAAGTALVARSDALLPYAAGSLALGEGADIQADSPAAAGITAPQRPQPVPGSEHGRENPADLPDHFALPPLRATPAGLNNPAPLMAARDAATGVRATSAAAPGAATEAEQLSAPAAAFAGPDSMLAPAHPVPPLSPLLPLAPARPAPPAPLAARERADIEPAVAATLAPRTVADRLRAEEPAPLMPRAPQPAPPSARPSSAAASGAPPGAGAAASGEGDTEVHIHIGRIDVTSVQNTPAARRRAPAGPAPLSLDGYLAQRGRS